MKEPIKQFTPKILVYVTKNYPTKQDAEKEKQILHVLNKNTSKIPIRIDTASAQLLEKLKESDIINSFEISSYDTSIGHGQSLYVTKTIKDENDKKILDNYLEALSLLNKIESKNTNTKENKKSIAEDDLEIYEDDIIEDPYLSIDPEDIKEIEDKEYVKNQGIKSSEEIKDPYKTYSILDNIFLKDSIATQYNYQLSDNNFKNNGLEYLLFLVVNEDSLKDIIKNTIFKINQITLSNIFEVLKVISNFKDDNILNLDLSDKENILNEISNKLTSEDFKFNNSNLNSNKISYLIYSAIENLLLEEEDVLFINNSNKSDKELNIISDLTPELFSEKFETIKKTLEAKGLEEEFDYNFLTVAIFALLKTTNKNVIEVLNKIDNLQELLFLFN